MAGGGSASRGLFAHESEQRLAELLGFYEVDWQYEPVEFVLDWDASGRPVSAFRPDFYLPELDLFLEVTTLRQDLVTRKHRKLRRFRQLYPEKQIRLLYRRDDAHLLLKSRLAG